MRIVCTPQIPATFLTWRSRRSELMHTVICKVTYKLAPGEAVLAQDHEPIVEHDHHKDDDEQKSLLAASDRVPFKRRADVVVVGAVFAPSGAPSRRVIARLAIGTVDKSLAAVSDRAVTRDGLVEEGRPFTRMPLDYERSRGGEDTDNPIGRTSARDKIGKLHLPNFQPVAFEPEAPDYYVPPIGLGPIPAIWPARMRRLGGHSALPPDALLERPEDFDATYFNVAPLDQQLDELATDAHLVLESLHPEHARLVTRLPGHRARALVDMAGLDLTLTCDTMHLDTDKGTCTLTWRGSFRGEGLAPEERVIVALEGADMRRSADQLRKAVPSGDETLTLKRSTIAIPERSGLPFGQALGAASSLSGMPFRPAGARADSAPALPSPPPPVVATNPQPSPSSAGVAAVAPAATAPPLLVVGAVPPPAHNAPVLSPAPPAPVVVPPNGVPTSPAPPAPVAPPPLSLSPMPVPPARASQPGGFPPPQPAHVISPAPPPMGVAPIASSRPSPTHTTQAPAYLSSPRAPAAPTGPVAHDAGAASRGVASASDAAARTDGAPKVKTSKAEVAPPTPKGPRAFVDILWIDGSAVARIRAHGPWSGFLKGSAKASPWLTEAASGEAQKREIDPERLVARAMSRAAAVDANGVQQAIHQAIDDDGYLDRPLVVVEGELALAYSPLEALRVSMALADPLGGTDRKLKEQLDAAADVAKPERKSAAGMIETALSRLRAAFAAANKIYPASFLEASAERVLVEERSFLKRVVLGGEKIVATISPATGVPLTVYLPEEVSSRLPLLPRFRARIVAEPHARQDASDGEGPILLTLALGRVVPPMTS